MTSQLLHGDCLELLAQLPSESVELIFADPPYMLSNGGTTVSSGERVSVDKGDWDTSKGFEEDARFHYDWIYACRRVLRGNGTMFISGSYHNIYQCGYALQRQGFRILNEITWYKPNPPPNFGCRCFTASHETVIWAAKSPLSKHTFNYDDMKNGDWSSDVLKNPGKQMKDVWSILPPGKTEKTLGKHPTQKPVRLLDRLILAATLPGDTVLDPFMGSGTTGVSAVNHGRNFIGIELDDRYVKLAQQRINP